MATPSPRNRPVAVYDPGRRETWGESDFERRQRLPIGADSNANPTGTPAGRSTMDPARLAGMISRGTARPGQVAAAQFASGMAGAAASLEGAKTRNEYNKLQLEAEKQGIEKLREEYAKWMNGDKQGQMPSPPPQRGLIPDPDSTSRTFILPPDPFGTGYLPVGPNNPFTDAYNKLGLPR